VADRARRGAPPYTEDDGWQPLRIWGMGIASHDLTGDGLPRGVPHQPGRQQAPDPHRRPRPPYERHRDPAGRHRPPPLHRRRRDALDRLARRVPDVNNDGFIDLFVAKGNVEAMPDHAAEDPNNLLLGQDPTAPSSRWPEEAGIVSFGPRPRAALVDLNLDGMLDLSR
jgi:enediyne biosynthesis protein E4